MTVSIYVIAGRGTVDHAPDVWFTHEGSSTPPVEAALDSGDTTYGTWIAHPVIPADATGSWSLVIADATTTTGDSASPATYSDFVRVGFPDPPTSLGAAATGVGTHVRLSWAAAHDGGRPITAYHVLDSWGRTVATTSGDEFEADVDLADSLPGRAPVYTVVSENAVGLSAASAASPLTAAPATAPEAPRNLVGRFRYGSANLTWQPSPHAFTSAVTSSVVTLEPGDETCTTFSLSCTVTGLTDGVVYTAEVRSVNSIGTGPPSAPLVLGPPAVTGFVADVLMTTAYLSWDADPNTADPPTYRVTTDQAGLGCTTTTTFCRLDGLEAGRTYAFTVRATNSLGAGAGVGPVSGTAFDVPSAPPPGPITRTDTAVSFRWSAADGRGKPVENYIVTGTSAHAGTWIDVLPATARSDHFSRLPPGVPFTFIVQAQNAVGEGPASTLGVVKLPDPFVVPGTPSRPRPAVSASKRITVAWQPVPSGAGTHVDRYDVAVLRAGHVVQDIRTDPTQHSTRTKVLPAGTYTVRVRAHNHAGWSRPSPIATATVHR